MALFVWEDKLSVDIELFDDQHKKLVELINKLYDGMKAGSENDILEEVLSDLVNYTITHFSSEEALFQKHGYPAFEQHKKEHDDFTKQVIEHRDSFKSGKTVVSDELMRSLLNWLYEHILLTDKKYTLFLNRKGVV